MSTLAADVIADACAEDEIAVIQLALVGLASDAARQRGLDRLSRLLGPDDATLDNYVRDLRTPAPPGAGEVVAASVAAALGPTPRQRRTAVGALHRTATRALPGLWRWIVDRSAESGGWTGWWSRCADHDTTVEWMAQDRAARCAAAAVDEWGRLGGVSTPKAEPTWRWLQTGRCLGAPGVDYRRALTLTATAFRQRGLLPTTHHVTLSSRTMTRSVAVPIRIPGRSVMVVSDTGSATDVRFLHHELAHVAEHAVRRADLPLDGRWSFDPVRSEGWALLCENLVHDPDWWAEIGLGPLDERTRAFHLAVDEFSRTVIDARVALDGMIDGCRDVVGLRRAGEEIAGRLGIDCHPAVLAMGVANGGQWRAYAAGFEWAERASEILTVRFGSPWWRAEASWRALRDVLETPGSARAALDRLRLAGTSPGPPPT